MTYPPQQPGPHGGPPQPGYGLDPWHQQAAHQGGYHTQPFPAQPPEPPRNTGKVVAIVLMAVLLLGGIGFGFYFLSRDSGGSQADAPPAPPPAPTTTTASDANEPGSGAGPAAIVEEYITAYETKSFAAVTNQACRAYKKKYGTDTAPLENQLERYTITGAAQGDPEVKGDVATARIALQLNSETDVKNVDIEIKIVKEDGEWRFCGEETA